MRPPGVGPCGESPCAKCYAGARHRAYYKGHFNQKHVPKKRGKMALPKIRKPGQSAATTPEGKPWKDVGFEQQFPHLMAFLSLERFEDGSPRTTGTLLFFVESGHLKACLNDRDGKRTVFLCADTHTALMLAIEEGLEEDSHAWRPRKS